MLHKGASTQHHNQQVLAKLHHNPSDRDQQAREKLQQKAKIRSQVYIELGEETLETVHSANGLFSFSLFWLFAGFLVPSCPKRVLVLGNGCERFCTSRSLLGSYVHQKSI